MSVKERRERERADRSAAILRNARELAEQEGWGAVTTRRLAERIEYSQPVLYSHFQNKEAIVAAVVRQACTELAAQNRRDAAAAPNACAALEAVITGYLAFARAHPATYAAMFTAPTELRFAAADTAPELKEAFASLREPLSALSGTDAEADLRTELLWSTLHGLATLTATDRIPLETQPARIALLVEALTSSEA